MFAKPIEIVKWLLRPQLWLAVVAASIFSAGFSRMLQAFSQSPPYVIAVGADGEFLKTVSRNLFLRHETTYCAIGIGIAIYVWWAVAKSLRDRELEYQREALSLKAETARLREMMDHEKYCLRRTEHSQRCTCPKDENARMEREFHILWRAAGSSPMYDKAAWNTVAAQLHSLGIVR